MRKNYLWYQFFRHTMVGNGLKFFYSKVKVVGKENIPKGKPILYIPNHQNSFMDALLVATTSKPTINFLTRAKAFKNPFMDWFLRSINMLPVYRVRDGLSSVQKNNAIFEQCISYLKDNETVLVFAEANHNLKRRIRPLSKGFTRIAFGAEEKHDWTLDLQLVPVGVNYTEHRNPRNTVQVNYGKAIPVSRYKEAFLEDETTATQQMKEEIASAMKELVFHVEDLESYPVYKMLWEVLEPDENKIIEPNISNERISKTTPKLTEELIKEAKSLESLANKEKIELRELIQHNKTGFKDILLLPFYLFSLANNAIPYQLVRYLTSSVIKDQCFYASIKFLTGLFTMPLFYILVSLIMLLFGVNSSFIWGYLGLSVVTGHLFVRSKQVLLRSQDKKLKKEKPAVYKEIQQRLDIFRNLRSSILNE